MRKVGVSSSLILSWLLLLTQALLLVGGCFDVFQCFDQAYSQCKETLNDTAVNGAAVPRIVRHVLSRSFSPDCSDDHGPRELDC